MKKFHLIFGLLVIVTFLLTGQYMDRYQQHLHGMPDGPRMMFRSRHIFILLSGLVHLALGTYWQNRRLPSRRSMQMLGSLLITLASVLFLLGFIYEPWLEGLYGPYARVGIYAIAFGTLVHFFSGVNEDKALVGKKE
jgi:hypothetical protein